MYEECPFCNPRPEQVLHEGTLVRILWDAFPVSEGHALLVTRRHVASWFEATEEERAELSEATLIARQRIEQRYRREGWNIGVNVGGAAGQTIGHLHLHVIPRTAGDVIDPRGGVRHVIPERGNYQRRMEDASRVEELPRDWPEAQAPLRPGPGVIGGPRGPLLPHIILHLDRATRADLVVAFVLESGVRAIEAALRGFLLRGGHLRLLTGDYMGVTDPRALLRLIDLKNYATDRVELFVFECGHSSFHPKAYLFGFDGERAGEPTEAVAYVGSSNLSRTALGDGIEWNYRLVLDRDREGFKTVVDSIEEVLAHPQTRPLSENWIAEYDARRPRRDAQTSGIPPEPVAPDPVPHALQAEALDALRETRRLGNRAGLVVMATGLGKTWLAAFDVAALESRRTLFVAHREEILRQALDTFRRVLPDASLGLYTGQQQAPEADVVFASIQCLGRANHLARFARSAFDYIVVDEFHHAAATTYTRLIEHFEPRFLLGLTATPERTDGGNLLGLCQENLVFRCDLFEAIRQAPERLVPFHYFGVPDTVDYTDIGWSHNKFDAAQLALQVETLERADNAFEEWDRRKGSCTLGFCCSRAHADFMAKHFLAKGVRAVAIHSGESSAPRATSLERLARGELDVVFAVDILNEGVDLPVIDTVLMLRPTLSRIIFLQQIGRGLRAAAGKTHLRIIDYIGNHRSFQMKARVILQLAAGDHPLRRALLALRGGQQDGFDLPQGCQVTYELEAIDLLEEHLRPALAADVLEEWYRDFEERTDRRPLALDAFHEGYNPRPAREHHGSWLKFVASLDGLDQERAELVRGDGLASAFLEELERTSMSRSLEMVVLLAMLHGDKLPGSMDLEDLAKEFTGLCERSARIQAQVTVDLSKPAAVRAYLRQNPIAAWCKPQGAGNVYFIFQGGQFRSTFDVPPGLRAAFGELVRELTAWRLADHFAGQARPRESPLRIVCKVMHAGGTPILKLPRRPVPPVIPEGELPVLANGQPHVARFVAQFINVVQTAEGEGNILKDLLRGWFGPQAGLPGTSQFVAFTQEGTVWTFEPLSPGEASRARVDG